MIKLTFNNKLLLGISKSKQIDFFKVESKISTYMEIPVKIIFFYKITEIVRVI